MGEVVAINNPVPIKFLVVALIANISLVEWYYFWFIFFLIQGKFIGLYHDSPSLHGSGNEYKDPAR